MDFEAFVEQELADLRHRLVEAGSRVSDAASHRTTQNFQHTIETLRNDQAQIASDNERLTAENAALTWEKNALIEEAQRNHRAALLDRLAQVFDQVDRAGSVTAVLAGTSHGLDGDFTRVAVFEVRDHHLEATEARGFDIPNKVVGLAVPLGVDSFLTLAARHRGVRVLGPETKQSSGAPPFGGEPTVVLTIPIAVRGELTAVIYADDAAAAGLTVNADESLKLGGLLQRHAALRIERLTIELKAVAELKAYAQMLLDEVEYVYEADRSGSAAPADRERRLQDNLRCARQIFQQRVTLEGPAAAALLEDIIAATVVSKGTTPFGQELAKVAIPETLAPAQA